MVVKWRYIVSAIMVNIGSGNGLSPFRRLANAWTNELIVIWAIQIKFQWYQNQNANVSVQEKGIWKCRLQVVDHFASDIMYQQIAALVAGLKGP